MTVAPLNAATPPSFYPVYTAPAGRVILGRTLPSLLDEACTNNPNEKAFNEAYRDGLAARLEHRLSRPGRSFSLSSPRLGVSCGNARRFFYPQ